MRYFGDVLLTTPLIRALARGFEGALIDVLVTAGTEGMLKTIATHAQPTTFLVATEPNMIWQFERRFPQHTFLPVPGIACACNICPHMAKNTLEKIRDCLRDMQPEIQWAPEFDQAEAVIRRSLL